MVTVYAKNEEGFCKDLTATFSREENCFFLKFTYRRIECRRKAQALIVSRDPSLLERYGAYDSDG